MASAQSKPFYDELHVEARLKGPDIRRVQTFTKPNYGEKSSKPVEIQATDLPVEWLVETRSSWERRKSVTWSVGLAALFFAWASIGVDAALSRLTLDEAGLSHRALSFFSGVLNDKWVSHGINFFASFVGLTIVITTWRFIERRLLKASAERRQVWIGGGTTTIGVGPSGLTIKTPRAIFAIDWSGVAAACLTKKTQRHPETGDHFVESGVNLQLKPVGSNNGEQEDVIFIPERFFADNESDLTWSEFLNYVSVKMGVPLAPCR